MPLFLNGSFHGRRPKALAGPLLGGHPDGAVALLTLI
jgi:hypothetical protein